jgi:hypothetical protein
MAATSAMAPTVLCTTGCKEWRVWSARLCRICTPLSMKVGAKHGTMPAFTPNSHFQVKTDLILSQSSNRQRAAVRKAHQHRIMSVSQPSRNMSDKRERRHKSD